jgi:hypothetical protein
VVGVVCTVRVEVAVALAATIIVDGVKLQAGRYCAPTGELVSVQVRFMVPEYLLPAATLTTAVVALPGDTGGGVETVMVAGGPGFAGADTVSVTGLESEVAKFAVPT